LLTGVVTKNGRSVANLRQDRRIGRAMMPQKC